MALHYELRPDEDLLAMSMSREALRLARTMQTTHSGSLWIPNGDGTGTLIGPGAGTDENGRPNGMQQFMGDLTAPPPPKGVTASCDNGILIVAWDGTLEEATPPDFDRIRIIVRPDGGAPRRSATSRRPARSRPACSPTASGPYGPSPSTCKATRATNPRA